MLDLNLEKISLRNNKDNYTIQKSYTICTSPMRHLHFLQFCIGVSKLEYAGVTKLALVELSDDGVNEYRTLQTYAHKLYHLTVFSAMERF